MNKLSKELRKDSRGVCGHSVAVIVSILTLLVFHLQPTTTVPLHLHIEKLWHSAPRPPLSLLRLLFSYSLFSAILSAATMGIFCSTQLGQYSSFRRPCGIIFSYQICREYLQCSTPMQYNAIASSHCYTIRSVDPVQPEWNYALKIFCISHSQALSSPSPPARSHSSPSPCC